MFVHAQAPVRIGIAGGGTDLPAWTKERTGICLSLAIKSHAHAVAITRSDHQVVASYRSRDTAPCATEIANGLIRESAILHGWEDGFEIHTMSEISSQGSGLGVSSSFAVALAATFARMTRLAEKNFSDESAPNARQWLAMDAWTVEIDRLRRPIGRQDHMAAAHGGLRLYAFEGDDAQIERTFSDDDATWLAKHLFLLRLPEGHDSRAILANVKESAQVQSAFDAVPVAVKAIESHDLQLLGEALWMGQVSKQSIPGAATAEIVKLVKSIQAISGVYGCKVAGAGGGGHVVIACDPEAASAIQATTQIAVVSVSPDFYGVQSEGWT